MPEPSPGTTLFRKIFSGAQIIAAFVLVAVLYLTGSFAFIENKIQDERFRYIQRDATAETVIVAIDSFSLKEVGVWPWPRSLHAKVLDKLVSAGAKRIAFNLDFSASSNPKDDQALEQSLKSAAGKVILIAFQQLQIISGENIFSTTQPIEKFRKYAVIAAANIRPDSDGKVRRYTVYQDINKKRVKTVPTVLASSTNFASAVYAIDYGIRPSSIPVISYADILFHRVDPKLLKGKNIIVGASAIELGGQLTVPVYRSLPSVMVIVQALESLLQNRAIRHIDPIVILVVTLFLSFFVGARFKKW